MEFDNVMDLRVVASQSVAVAKALETDEDKVYWLAFGASCQLIEVFSPTPERDVAHIKEWTTNLFAQTFMGTSVVLPNEFKAYVVYLAGLCFTPDALTAQVKSLEEMCNVLEEMED